MIKKMKKGFTLVELVVVIVIIGILAAVMIPTLTSYIEKANEASDISLAKNMNMLLSTDFDLDKDSYDDVLFFLEENGFKLENMNPRRTGNRFLWDKASNSFVYLDEEQSVIFPTEYELSNKSDLWLTIKNEKDVDFGNGEYSYFLVNNLPLTKEMSIKGNFDTGSFKLASSESYPLTVKGNSELRGTYSNVVVDSNGNVENFASIEKATIKNVSYSSYHEKGYVKELVVADGAKGNIVISEGAIVEKLSIENAANLSKDLNAAKNSSNIFINTTDSNGYVGLVESTGTVQNEVTIPVATTTGVTNTINSYTDLINFREKVNNGAHFNGVTVKLNKDIDLTGRLWEPIGWDNRDNKTNITYYFSGTFDGQGHTIKGLSNKGFTCDDSLLMETDVDGKNYQAACFGFFGVCLDAIIQNLKMLNVNIIQDKEEGVILDSVGALAGYADGRITIKNCTTSGNITAMDAVSGMVGRIYNHKYPTALDGNTTGKAPLNVVFEDCTNNINTTSISDKTAGFIGFVSNANAPVNEDDNTSNYGTITFKNCHNTGNIESKSTGVSLSAGLMVCDKQIDKIELLLNCTNTGTITCNKTASSARAQGELVAGYGSPSDLTVHLDNNGDGTKDSEITSTNDAKGYDHTGYTNEDYLLIINSITQTPLTV